MKKIVSLLLLFCFLFTLSLHAVASDSEVSIADWERISAKLAQLNKVDYLSMAKSPIDWLIDNSKYKAKVYAGKDGKSVVISNGLVARVFRIDPNLATIDIVNQMTSESMLRAVSPEGELVIDGKKWALGGLKGQPERGYFKQQWLNEMTVADNSFVVADFEIVDTIHTLKWAKSRWALNKNMPTGKSLVFTM